MGFVTAWSVSALVLSSALLAGVSGLSFKFNVGGAKLDSELDSEVGSSLSHQGYRESDKADSSSQLSSGISWSAGTGKTSGKYDQGGGGVTTSGSSSNSGHAELGGASTHSTSRHDGGSSGQGHHASWEYTRPLGQVSLSGTGNQNGGGGLHSYSEWHSSSSSAHPSRTADISIGGVRNGGDGGHSSEWHSSSSSVDHSIPASYSVSGHQNGGHGGHGGVQTSSEWHSQPSRPADSNKHGASEGYRSEWHSSSSSADHSSSPSDSSFKGGYQIGGDDQTSQQTSSKWHSSSSYTQPSRPADRNKNGGAEGYSSEWHSSLSSTRPSRPADSSTGRNKNSGSEGHSSEWHSSSSSVDHSRPSGPSLGGGFQIGGEGHSGEQIISIRHAPSTRPSQADGNKNKGSGGHSSEWDSSSSSVEHSSRPAAGSVNSGHQIEGDTGSSSGLHSSEGQLHARVQGVNVRDSLEPGPVQIGVHGGTKSSSTSKLSGSLGEATEDEAAASHDKSGLEEIRDSHTGLTTHDVSKTDHIQPNIKTRDYVVGEVKKSSWEEKETKESSAQESSGLDFESDSRNGHKSRKESSSSEGEFDGGVNISSGDQEYLKYEEIEYLGGSGADSVHRSPEISDNEGSFKSMVITENDHKTVKQGSSHGDAVQPLAHHNQQNGKISQTERPQNTNSDHDRISKDHTVSAEPNYDVSHRQSDGKSWENLGAEGVSPHSDISDESSIHTKRSQRLTTESSERLGGKVNRENSGESSWDRAAGSEWKTAGDSRLHHNVPQWSTSREGENSEHDRNIGEKSTGTEHRAQWESTANSGRKLPREQTSDSWEESDSRHANAGGNYHGPGDWTASSEHRRISSSQPHGIGRRVEGQGGNTGRSSFGTVEGNDAETVRVEERRSILSRDSDDFRDVSDETGENDETRNAGASSSNRDRSATWTYSQSSSRGSPIASSSGQASWRRNYPEYERGLNINIEGHGYPRHGRREHESRSESTYSTGSNHGSRGLGSAGTSIGVHGGRGGYAGEGYDGETAWSSTHHSSGSGSGRPSIHGGFEGQVAGSGAGWESEKSGGIESSQHIGGKTEHLSSSSAGALGKSEHSGSGSSGAQIGGNERASLEAAFPLLGLEFSKWYGGLIGAGVQDPLKLAMTFVQDGQAAFESALRSQGIGFKLESGGIPLFYQLGGKSESQSKNEGSGGGKIGASFDSSHAGNPLLKLIPKFPPIFS